MTPTMWVEKYRPSQISDFIFQDESLREHITNYIDLQDIPHLLFSGPPGTGKTTLAMILADVVADPMDILVINASTENSVDTIREKVHAWCVTAPMGKLKVIILDEADAITKQGQSGLRRMMEEYSSTVRFILTANYPMKLIDALSSSRCIEYTLKTFPIEAIAERCIGILTAEGVEWDNDSLISIINAGYPDMRNIVGALQSASIRGKLLPKSSGARKEFEGVVRDCVATNNWKGLQTIVYELDEDELDATFTLVHRALPTSPTFADRTKWERAIILTAEYLYKHGFVADKTINVLAYLIEIDALTKDSK